MARQKRTFDTDEIPHLWAHQTQSEATNKGRNLYFEAATIFSYGSHFPIASFRDGKRKNSRAVLFTIRTYSVTTAKHIELVRRSIPSDVTVFHVPHVTPNAWEHGKNCEYYREQIRTAYNEAVTGHKGKRAERLRRMIEASETGKQYAAFFGLRGESFKLPITAAKLRTIQEQAEQDERTYNGQIEQRRSVFGWQELNAMPTMLRIEGTDVVTSRGARFPVRHAVRGLRLVKLVMRREQAWKRNGETCSLGDYQIDSIETNGTVHAGCHTVLWAEIERIAPKLEAWEAIQAVQDQDSATV